MSNATQNRSQALPRRFPAGSISEAVRVIEESLMTLPMSPARIAHIDRTLAGLARLFPSRGL
jgi:hypothetical protein